MKQTNYLKDISLLFLFVSVGAICVVALVNADGHLVGVYYAAPASFIGIAALITAVLSGARRLWLLSIPILLAPLVPVAMLWVACTFYGDCV